MLEQIVLGQRSGDRLHNDSKTKRGFSQQLSVPRGDPQAETCTRVSERDGLGLKGGLAHSYVAAEGEENTALDSTSSSATSQLWNCGTDMKSSV